MANNSNPLSLSSFFQRDSFLQLFFFLTLGIGFGGLFVFSCHLHPAFGIGFTAAVFATAVFLVRPFWGFLAFILCLVFIEEFPSLQGETVERSTRTLFYSLSLGIPGFYSTDALLSGLMSLKILELFLTRKSWHYRLDSVGFGILLLMAVIVVSVALSLTDPSLFDVNMESGFLGVGYEINDRGAKLIAFFHFKCYGYLFLSYILGLLFLRTPEDFGTLKKALGFAVFGLVLIGLERIAFHMDEIKQLHPLFYHSPSNWIFALIFLFTVLSWAHQTLTPRWTAVFLCLSLILMGFVLISYRRTMWAGILTAYLFMMFFMIPPRARLRLLGVSFLSAVVLGGLLFLSPLGQHLGGAVTKRIGETTVEDPSTLYRLDLFIYLVNHFFEIPWFGYGARPLWDKIAALGFFRANLEHIHSLYYWWLVRTGVIGLSFSLLAWGIIFRSNWNLIRSTRVPHFRVMASCIFLAAFILLFSGFFNPVYGEARYMILMGILLSLVSRMIQWDHEWTPIQAPQTP